MRRSAGADLRPDRASLCMPVEPAGDRTYQVDWAPSTISWMRASSASCFPISSVSP